MKTAYPKTRTTSHPILSETAKATREAIAWGKKEAKRIEAQEKCRAELVLMVKKIREKQKKTKKVTNKQA